MGRWDTTAHRADDPRRRDAKGNPFPPVHDVQMMVEGPAAAEVAAVVRARWLCATGRRLRPVRKVGEPWPPSVAPDLENVQVAVARTVPAYQGEPELREIEALFVDAIRRARRWIYVENQYLTAAHVGEALLERLREPDGPEILVVNPGKCAGWLEESTMGVLRARLLRRIRASDPYDRFRIYYPTAPGLGDARINVHAKLMIVDGRFVHIGSANLNNRSMGLDSECDLAVEDPGDGSLRPAVMRFVARLLAEHLGASSEAVLAMLERTGSPSATVEALRGGERTLEPLDGAVSPWLESVVPEAAVVDPERPIAAAELQEMVAPLGAAAPRQWPLLAAGVFAALVVAVWLWTPIRDWLDPHALLRMLVPLAHSTWAPLLVAGMFVAGGLLMVPVTLLIVVTAAAFGPGLGGFYALVGALLSAATGYGLGQLLGRQRVRRLFGSRLSRIGNRLSRHGIAVVTVIRLLPLAPYSIVNVAAGAAQVGLRDFLIGTALGMLPGVFGAALFAEQLLRTVRRPEPANVVLLVVVVTALLLVARWIERSLTGPRAPGGGLAARLAARFRTSGRDPGTPAPPRRPATRVT